MASFIVRCEKWTLKHAKKIRSFPQVGLLPNVKNVMGAKNIEWRSRKSYGGRYWWAHEYHKNAKYLGHILREKRYLLLQLILNGKIQRKRGIG